MHYYAFEMYLKDGPLRSSDYIFAKCMLYYFAGNIKRQGREGGGGGVGEEEVGNFNVSFVCK